MGGNNSKLLIPIRGGRNSEAFADTRWALAWKMVDGGENAEARLAAKDCQNPDLMDGSVDTSGCVSFRFAYSPVISRGTLKKWSLDTKNALLWADGSCRDVLLRAPVEVDPANPHFIWELCAPPFGLNDAPDAYRRPPQK